MREKERKKENQLKLDQPKRSKRGEKIKQE